MGQVIAIAQFGNQKAETALRLGWHARNDIDIDAQLAQATLAHQLCEPQADANERSLAGLLDATGLEIDALAERGHVDEAAERAMRTQEILSQHDEVPVAQEISGRYVLRCKEMAGETDPVMRQAQAAFLRLQRHPLTLHGSTRREAEMLALLTLVLSSAHRQGGNHALRFGREASRLATRSVEGGKSIYAIAAPNHPRIAARFDLWRGLFLSGTGGDAKRVTASLSSYLRWTSSNRTRRNRLVERFALAELMLSDDRPAALDLLARTIDDTFAVLPRKANAASEILSRRGLIGAAC